MKTMPSSSGDRSSNKFYCTADWDDPEIWAWIIRLLFCGTTLFRPILWAHSWHVIPDLHVCNFRSFVQSHLRKLLFTSLNSQSTTREVDQENFFGERLLACLYISWEKFVRNVWADKRRSDLPCIPFLIVWTGIGKLGAGEGGWGFHAGERGQEKWIVICISECYAVLLMF